MYRQNSNSSSATWQVALYLRLSREDGNDESLSIKNQRSILMEYIEESFGEPYNIVDEYIDDGETGTDVARPEFKRMINDVEAGRVNCIIVKDLKRFMRNHGYQALYLEQIFPKNDTRFITVSEPRLDTFRNPNAVYGFDVPMHGIMNDRYAQGTSEAVKRTFANKTKQGKFIGAFCPYGYAGVIIGISPESLYSWGFCRFNPIFNARENGQIQKKWRCADSKSGAFRSEPAINHSFGIRGRP